MVSGPKLPILLLVCSIIAASVAAQSVSVVSGTVQDPSGAVIPNASVVLQTKSPNSSLSRAASDSNGTFHFENVPPGFYNLIISASGFKDATITVAVTTKRPAPLRITLALAPQSESVTVGASDTAPRISTETAENQSNTFERNVLDRVPVFDQDYISTLSRFLDDNATSTNGVSLVVNGIEANGPGVTPSAIQEVRINQNPYTVFFANPGRARLEITTKSGTPDFHGTVNFLYRDAVFDAANAFAIQKPDESRQYYEGSLSGPAQPRQKNYFPFVPGSRS